ncbi:MAG: sigma-70 family RNA polymerase sigma factor [Planctomycetota bacterium]
MHEERFLPLFLKHERALAAFARSLLPDWEAVDDVIQNASLVMWRKLDSLENDDEFLRWAMVVVRMEVLKYRRTKARDRFLLSDKLIEQLANESKQDDAMEAFQDRSQALAFCLNSFSHEHQQLLLAPYRSHGSVIQLANSIGSSANSLYKRIGRLRIKLHECIDLRLRASGGIV